MAITRVSKQGVAVFFGLAADTKPSASVGDQFWETDTFAGYTYSGTAWFPGGTGGGGGSSDATAANQTTGNTSLGIMDDWDESDRAKVNPIAGQAGVDGGAGAASAKTVRIIMATDHKRIEDCTLTAVGELQGATSATQGPTVTAKFVRYKARSDNAGSVYLGISGVTKADGTTDTTTGLELVAGDDTGWIPATNLNTHYRIADNAGDDLTYLVMT